MSSCQVCQADLNPGDIYCGNCGTKRRIDRSKKENESVRQVIIFYITFLIFAVVSYVTYLENNLLLTEIILESIFVLLTLGFSLFDIKGILALYRFDRINWKNLLFALVFPIFSAVAVYFGMGLLNELLFFEDYNLFYDYISYDNPFLWAFIFYAILPPIFEELAFRGFLFNKLRDVASANVTILATAFIFALVHFSFISFIWIFPFGIVLGYLRHRFKTLWLGMIVHFIHNLLVVLIEYYYFYQDPWNVLLE